MHAGEHIDTIMRGNPKFIQSAKSGVREELTIEKGKELFSEV